MFDKRILLQVVIWIGLVSLAPPAWAGVVTADLAITKTDGAASSIPGDTVTYTITATNNGPADVTGATVADTFPAVLSGCTWTCVASAGSSCTAAGAGNINDSADLLNGGTATYTATCTIDASATGNLANTATVSSAANDPNMADNSATDTNTLTPSADLAITKTDGAASSTPGGMITYTITATNNGLSDITGATVADTFPAALSGCTWTCVASAGSTCTAAGAGNINDSVDLLVGGTATYTATCNIDPAATGNLANTATVSSAATDPNMANNSATDTNTLAASADLSVSLLADPMNPGAGEAFMVMVTVMNNGPSGATNVVVTTTLPAGSTLVSTMGCAEDPNGVPTCSLGTIAAGAMATFEINAIAPTVAGPGNIDVTVSSDASDPVTANDSDTVVIDVAGVDVLAIPTASTWGLVLLALLLAAGAFWQMRRRQIG